MRFFPRGARDGGRPAEAQGIGEALKVRLSALGERDATERLEPDAHPTPVTMRRVVARAMTLGLECFVTVDGGAGVIQDGRLYRFVVQKDPSVFLVVRTEWMRPLAIERLGEILELCNEWNTGRVWPSAFIRVHDNGLVRVYGDIATSLAEGATDAQLDALLCAGIGAGSALLDLLDHHYADPARQAP